MRASFLACLWLMPGPLLNSIQAGEGLRAGMARTDITPTQPVLLDGYEMRQGPSQGIHDPLSARAMAFDQDGQRLVFVSVDVIGFYRGTAEPLRQAVLDACQLKPSELLLCAIHTHSAPGLALSPEQSSPANVEYTRAFQGKLIEVVRTALGRLAPMQVAVGSGSSPVGVNRREVVHGKDGTTRIELGRNRSVVTDREVQVLTLFRPGESRPAGVLFAYATHSTSLGWKNYLISGDIQGIAEQFLEGYFGAGFVAPGFAGASGNIDPWVRVLPDFRTTNGWVPEPVLMGTMLGEEVARVVETIPISVTNCTIRGMFRTAGLPAKARAEGLNVTGATAPLNITVARLGDIAFVGWGGEIFNEIGQAVKSASPFRRTFILTHCNGMGGYLPTRPAYAEGGYEIRSSPFAPGAAAALIEETLKMLRELHG
jgi:Neutral/alkaline non-lysosomal ceramidase, N-terminal